MAERKNAIHQLRRARRRFRRALRRCKRAPDEETLHELRILARRLRAYCHLVGEPEVDRELRWLVRKTNRLRDLDVAALGAKRGKRKIRAALKIERTAVGKTLRSARMRRLKRGLDRLPRLERKAARKWIDRLYKKVSRREQNGEAEADLHALRRALREL